MPPPSIFSYDVSYFLLSSVCINSLFKIELYTSLSEKSIPLESLLALSGLSSGNFLFFGEDSTRRDSADSIKSCIIRF